MSDHIARKAELYVTEYLRSVIPDGKFHPSHGEAPADETQGVLSDPHSETKVAAIVPPYTEIVCRDKVKVLSTESTWQLQIDVAYVSHIDDETPEAHSAAVNEIYRALGGLPRGLQAAQQLVVSGTDVEEMPSVEGLSGGARADVVRVVMGCSG